ncbi:MAG: VOC family protein [Opitutaceae bacterium]
MSIAPSLTAPSLILGLSHVAVKATDIERSCAFYREFLGFSEHCRLNYLTTGELMLVCFKINDDQWIEVFTGLKPGENRLHQVAFRVTDAEQIRRCLAASHFDVPENTPIGQMGNFNFVVTDPSGQIVEFVQPLPTGITERDRGKFLPATRVSTQLLHARVFVSDLKRDETFYAALGLAAKPNSAALGDKPNLKLRQTIAGDFVEFVADLQSESVFSLGVGDITETVEQLERSPYRPRYAGSLRPQRQSDGTAHLDIFDPDGTCVRLIELALASAS